MILDTNSSHSTCRSALGGGVKLRDLSPATGENEPQYQNTTSSAINALIELRSHHTDALREASITASNTESDKGENSCGYG